MLRSYIKIIAVDRRDISVGLAVDDVMIATVVVENSAICFLVDAPGQKGYYLLNAQVAPAGPNGGIF